MGFVIHLCTLTFINIHGTVKPDAETSTCWVTPAEPSFDWVNRYHLSA